jgi:hypothetical protein
LFIDKSTCANFADYLDGGSNANRLGNLASTRQEAEF